MTFIWKDNDKLCRYAGENFYIAFSLTLCQFARSKSQVQPHNHVCNAKSVADRELTPDNLAKYPPEPKPAVAPSGL
jgi:hypothetical protein